MRSFSEIETAVKRATRGIGFSWGVAEEVGKNIRLLEMFGLPGFKNINQYFKKRFSPSDANPQQTFVQTQLRKIPQGLGNPVKHYSRQLHIQCRA